MPQENLVKIGFFFGSVGLGLALQKFFLATYEGGVAQLYENSYGTISFDVTWRQLETNYPIKINSANFPHSLDNMSLNLELIGSGAGIFTSGVKMKIFSGKKPIFEMDRPYNLKGVLVRDLKFSCLLKKVDSSEHLKSQGGIPAWVMARMLTGAPIKKEWLKHSA